MYFDLGDEVGGEGSVVLTGVGAAPLLPPGSWLRTLASKHATHGSFHLPPNQRCGTEERRGVRKHLQGLTRPPMPVTVSSWLCPHVPSTLSPCLPRRQKPGLSFQCGDLTCDVG